MNDEINFFSEIDDMKAELNDVWGSRNRKRNRRQRLQEVESQEIPEETTIDNPDDRSAMAQEIEEMKQANRYPNDFRYDLTIKQEGNRRGERIPKDNYEDLQFGSLIDVIKKHR